MADTRSAELQAAEQARLIHDQYDTRKRLVHSYGGLDVYRLAEDLDLPVRFTKLKGLLGFYMNEPIPGIGVTTERPPAVQRFTCAHELGHHSLGHETVLDVEANIAFGRGAPAANDIKEYQANVFASHLLMPKWLLHDRAKDLLKAGLRIPDPLAVYQLALRLGTSYQATVNTLFWRNLITRTHRANLFAIQPKEIKQNILIDVALAGDWHRDVWLLTPHDDGGEVQARSADLIVMRVPELAASGYVNDFRVSDSAKVLLTRTEAPSGAAEHIGGALEYTAIANLELAGKSAMTVRQRRPWEPAENASVAMSLNVDVAAKIAGGMSHDARVARMKEASAL
ncbi:ImmA/IrrE family metallo-endopeptidase [Solimonas terrae]|uniref:ImmA/IrrE family metallo-endopeptidase n=1 Tax=Solimonas terrae TaxID=1396819 RepID=A0A6M2BU30_9GAMM|nr:ImmA/IrrE family metallo-endopeptidase [Solimonas terrae]NGY05613.1 ImmA/IrrE family metallo-endopeptidase [Solimonas terrae]